MSSNSFHTFTLYTHCWAKLIFHLILYTLLDVIVPYCVLLHFNIFVLWFFLRSRHHYWQDIWLHNCAPICTRWISPEQYQCKIVQSTMHTKYHLQNCTHNIAQNYCKISYPENTKQNVPHKKRAHNHAEPDHDWLPEAIQGVKVEYMGAYCMQSKKLCRV